MPYIRKRRYRRRSKVPTKRKAIRKAVKSVKDARIKAVVKRVLGTQAETKLIQLSASPVCKSIQLATTQGELNQQVQCVSPFGTGGVSLMNAPVIGSGVGQDQRIGDELRTKATYINYLLTALPYNATSNLTPKSYICEVWLVQPKVQQLTFLDVARIQAGSATADFFENQTNAESGFSGLSVDMLRKVDRDNFKVLAKRTHKIGWDGTLNTTNVVSSFGNNDFKQFVRGRIKIPGYIMKFDRNDLPMKQPYYFFVQVMNADGTTLSTSQIPVSCQMNCAIYYTDM